MTKREPLPENSSMKIQMALNGYVSELIAGTEHSHVVYGSLDQDKLEMLGAVGRFLGLDVEATSEPAEAVEQGPARTGLVSRIAEEMYVSLANGQDPDWSKAGSFTRLLLRKHAVLAIKRLQEPSAAMIAAGEAAALAYRPPRHDGDMQGEDEWAPENGMIGVAYRAMVQAALDEP